MSRQFILNSVNFVGVRITMESFVDPWGEDDSLIGDAVARGYDENESLAMWAYLAQAAPENAVMMDVGAYAGIYSLFACKLNSSIRVCSFEASAITYGRLTKNIILNGVESRVAPARMAAWKDDGELTFKHRYGIFSICAGDSAALEFDEDHVERVLAVPLDSLFKADASPPGVFASKAFGLRADCPLVAIKIDVEGAELEVLQGAQALLRDRRPVLLCEILEDSLFQEIARFLERFGYIADRIEEERNFLLCPQERLAEFRSGFLRWKHERMHEVKLTVDRDLILNIR